jgi:hypothetical protein
MNVNCAISNFPGRAHTKQTKTSATSLAMLRQARTLRLHQRQEAPPPHPAELNSTDLPPPMPNRLHRRRPRPSARKQPSSLSTTLTSTARTRLPHKLTWGSSSRSYAYLARSDLFVCLLLHVFIVPNWFFNERSLWRLDLVLLVSILCRSIVSIKNTCVCDRWSSVGRCREEEKEGIRCWLLRLLFATESYRDLS